MIPSIVTIVTLLAGSVAGLIKISSGLHFDPASYRNYVPWEWVERIESFYKNEFAHKADSVFIELPNTFPDDPDQFTVYSAEPLMDHWPRRTAEEVFLIDSAHKACRVLYQFPVVYGVELQEVIMPEVVQPEGLINGRQSYSFWCTYHVFKIRQILEANYKASGKRVAEKDIESTKNAIIEEFNHHVKERKVYDRFIASCPCIGQDVKITGRSAECFVKPGNTVKGCPSDFKKSGPVAKAAIKAKSAVLGCASSSSCQMSSTGMLTMFLSLDSAASEARMD